jgi:hypothetical protein
MAYLSLSPVSAALYTALNVAGMTALVGSRIYDDVPRAPTYPFVWFEVGEPRDVRGFGGGGMPEVAIRVHAFTQYQGEKQGQTIIAKAIELLRDVALTVTGYEQAGRVFYDETVVLRDQEIEGVKVQEMVAVFRTYVKES